MELSLDLILVIIALVCAIVSLFNSRVPWLTIAVILLAIAALPLG